MWLKGETRKLLWSPEESEAERKVENRRERDLLTPRDEREKRKRDRDRDKETKRQRDSGKETEKKETTRPDRERQRETESERDREEKNGGGGEDNPLRDGQRRWCSWILDNKEEVDS